MWDFNKIFIETKYSFKSKNEVHRNNLSVQIAFQVTRTNSWISSSLLSRACYIYTMALISRVYLIILTLCVYEQENRSYIINATFNMIDGVKTSHPKNLHACRCKVTIGSYPLTEHIRRMFQGLKVLCTIFACMSVTFLCVNIKVVLCTS